MNYECCHPLCALSTGYLHIGGARTALFNWLFARHRWRHLSAHRTDKARSTDAAVAAIHEAKLAGLGGANQRSANLPKASAMPRSPPNLSKRGGLSMLFKILNYRHFAQNARQPAPVRSPWRDKAPADAPELPFTVRMKMPSGRTTIEDAVQGAVTIQNKVLDDMVIAR